MTNDELKASGYKPETPPDSRNQYCTRHDQCNDGWSDSTPGTCRDLTYGDAISGDGYGPGEGPVWHDSTADHKTCQWYADFTDNGGTACDQWGDAAVLSWPFPNGGNFTANEACCACGGGTEIVPPRQYCDGYYSTEPSVQGYYGCYECGSTYPCTSDDSCFGDDSGGGNNDYSGPCPDGSGCGRCVNQCGAAGIECGDEDTSNTHCSYLQMLIPNAFDTEWHNLGPGQYGYLYVCETEFDLTDSWGPNSIRAVCDDGTFSMIYENGQTLHTSGDAACTDGTRAECWGWDGCSGTCQDYALENDAPSGDPYNCTYAADYLGPGIGVCGCNRLGQGEIYTISDCACSGEAPVLSCAELGCGYNVANDCQCDPGCLLEDPIDCCDDYCHVCGSSDVNCDAGNTPVLAFISDVSFSKLTGDSGEITITATDADTPTYQTMSFYLRTGSYEWSVDGGTTDCVDSDGGTSCDGVGSGINGNIFDDEHTGTATLLFSYDGEYTGSQSFEVFVSDGINWDSQYVTVTVVDEQIQLAWQNSPSNNSYLGCGGDCSTCEGDYLVVSDGPVCDYQLPEDEWDSDIYSLVWAMCEWLVIDGVGATTDISGGIEAWPDCNGMSGTSVINWSVTCKDDDDEDIDCVTCGFDSIWWQDSMYLDITDNCSANVNVTVTADDGITDPVSTSWRVIYYDINAAPVMQEIGDVEFDEGETYTTTVTASQPGSGGEPDTDNLTYSCTVESQYAYPPVCIMTQNGDNTATMALSAPGSMYGSGGDVTVTVCDDGTDQQGNDNLCGSTEFHVDVIQVNMAPVATPWAVTIEEDSGWEMYVNDANRDDGLQCTDQDDGFFEFTLLTEPTLGQISVDEDGGGTFLYKPDANTYGTDTFTWSCSDGQYTSESTGTITINPVNDGPFAPDYDLTTNEDTAGTVVITCTDVDTSVSNLSVAITSGPSNGTAVANYMGATASIQYTPSTNYNGTDEIIYECSDGNSTSEGTITINVTAVTDIPVAVNQTVTDAVEDTEYFITLTCDNPDNLEELFEIIEYPANGTLFFPEGHENPGDILWIENTAHSSATTGNGVCCTPYEWNLNECGYYTGIADLYDNATDCCNAWHFHATYGDDTSGGAQSYRNYLDLTWPSQAAAHNSDASIYQCGTFPPTLGNIFRYVPNPSFNGSDTFKYKCHNGNGSITQAWDTTTGPQSHWPMGEYGDNFGNSSDIIGTVTIQIAPVEDFPVIIPIQINTFIPTTMLNSQSISSYVLWYNTYPNTHTSLGHDVLKYYHVGNIFDYGECWTNTFCETDLPDELECGTCEYDAAYDHLEWTGLCKYGTGHGDLDYLACPGGGFDSWDGGAPYSWGGGWPFIHTQGTLYRDSNGVVVQDLDAEQDIVTLQLPEDSRQCISTSTREECDGEADCHCGGFTSELANAIDSSNVFPCTADDDCLSTGTTGTFPGAAVGSFVVRGYSRHSRAATENSTFTVASDNDSVSVACNTGDSPYNHYTGMYQFYWGVPAISDSAWKLANSPGGPWFTFHEGWVGELEADEYGSTGTVTNWDWTSGPNTDWNSAFTIRTSTCEVTTTPNYNTTDDGPATITVTYTDGTDEGLVSTAKFKVEVVPSDDLGTISTTLLGSDDDTLNLPDSSYDDGFVKLQGLHYPTTTPGTDSDYSSYYKAFDFTVSDIDTSMNAIHGVVIGGTYDSTIFPNKYWDSGITNNPSELYMSPPAFTFIHPNGSSFNVDIDPGIVSNLAEGTELTTDGREAYVMFVGSDESRFPYKTAFPGSIGGMDSTAYNTEVLVVYWKNETDGWVYDGNSGYEPLTNQFTPNSNDCILARIHATTADVGIESIEEYGNAINMSSLAQIPLWYRDDGAGTWETTTGPNGELARKRTGVATSTWAGTSIKNISVNRPGEYTLSFYYRNWRQSYPGQDPAGFSRLSARQCSEDVSGATTSCCDTYNGHEIIPQEYPLVVGDSNWNYYEKTFEVLPTGATTNNGNCPTIRDQRISIRVYDGNVDIDSEITIPIITPRRIPSNANPLCVEGIVGVPCIKITDGGDSYTDPTTFYYGIERKPTSTETLDPLVANVYNYRAYIFPKKAPVLPTLPDNLSGIRVAVHESVDNSGRDYYTTAYEVLSLDVIDNIPDKNPGCLHPLSGDYAPTNNIDNDTCGNWFNNIEVDNNIFTTTLADELTSPSPTGVTEFIDNTLSGTGLQTFDDTNRASATINASFNTSIGDMIVGTAILMDLKVSLKSTCGDVVGGVDAERFNIQINGDDYFDDADNYYVGNSGVNAGGLRPYTNTDYTDTVVYTVELNAYTDNTIGIHFVDGTNCHTVGKCSPSLGQYCEIDADCLYGNCGSGNMANTCGCDMNLKVSKISLRRHTTDDTSTWNDMTLAAPPTGVTVSGQGSSDGNMWSAGTMIFTITEGWFRENGFRIVDTNVGQESHYELFIPTNKPEYGQITGSLSTGDASPDWYDSGVSIPQNEASWSTTYHLDNVPSTPLGNGLTGSPGLIWNDFCQPFNELIQEDFTLQLKAFTYYNGVAITPVDDNGIYTYDYTFDIFNNHPDFVCNNFDIQTPLTIDAIDIKIDVPTKTIDWDTISGLYCSDGSRCTPDVLYEELIPRESGYLGWDSDLADPAEPFFERTFILPDGFGEQECSIELIIEDAERGVIDTTGAIGAGAGGNVELWFKSANANHNTPTSVPGDANYPWNPGGSWIGDLSSGLYSGIYGNNIQNTFAYNTNVVGGDPENINWVYTTGFAGGITSEGDLTYLAKTICTEGDNTIYVRGEEDDDAYIRNIRVTNHNKNMNYEQICNDGSQCGLLGDLGGELITSRGIANYCTNFPDSAACGPTGASTAEAFTGSPTQDLYFEYLGGRSAIPGTYFMGLWMDWEYCRYKTETSCGNGYCDWDASLATADELAAGGDPCDECCSTAANHDTRPNWWNTNYNTIDVNHLQTGTDEVGSITLGNVFMAESNYGNSFSTSTDDGGTHTSNHSAYSQVGTYLEFFSLDYSIHFIGERIYTSPGGAPFGSDDDGIWKIVYCFPGGCTGTVGTDTSKTKVNLRVKIGLDSTDVQNLINNTPTSAYETNGWGTIQDNSIQQLLGEGDNYNRCIAFGHCNQDGTLTRKGLIAYDYKINVDLGASKHISTSGESFNDILIEGTGVDIGDFLERHSYAPNKTLGIVANRNEFDNCCVEGLQCYRAEQTNFKLDYITVPDNIFFKNYISDPTFKDITLGDSSIDECENATCTVSSEESLMGQYSFKMVNDSINHSYTAPHIGTTAIMSPAESGESWTFSVWCKAAPGTETENSIWVIGLNDSYHWSYTGDNDNSNKSVTCTDEWTRHELIHTFDKEDTKSVTFRIDGGVPYVAGATTYWDGLQLEKSNRATTFYDHISRTDDATFTHADDNLYQLLLHGKILNSPLAFCDGDNFLIDSARGYGSAEYSSNFKVITGKYNNTEYDNTDEEVLGGPNTGHPSYPITCPGGVADCLIYGSNLTCPENGSVVTTNTCVPSDALTDAGSYYYPTTQIYDGWSEDSEYPTIRPGNLGEQSVPILRLYIKRDFHDLYTSTASHLIPAITINVIGINPPHIHFLNYDSESNPQIGVQSTEALKKNPTLKYYDNINNDIMSEEYIDELDGNIFINRNDDFGVKSIGSIDFSSYEGISNAQPRAYLTVDGVAITDSRQEHLLQAYTSIDNASYVYIWDNIVKAVNDFNGDYTARISAYSDPNPSSNIKEVIIEAKTTGQKWNGVLGWTIPTDSPTRLMESEPTFNPLVNGVAYPIVHVYEDFGTIDLLLAASDRDKYSNMEVDIQSSNDEAFTIEIVETSEYSTDIGYAYGEIFTWLGYGNMWDNPPTYIDLSTEELDGQHSKLSHTNSIVRLHSTPNWNGEVDISARVTDNDSAYDSIIFKLRVHPVNDPPIVTALGDTNLYMNNEFYPNDINIRIETTDNEEGTCENGISRNKTDCLNNYTCGDGTEQCVWTTNNSFIHLVDTQIVDGESEVDGNPNVGSYCWKVQQAVDLITATGYAPQTLNGQTVLPDSLAHEADCDGDPDCANIAAKCTDMIYCSTICYEKMGMSRENAEEFCGFAAYGNVETDTSEYEPNYTISNDDVVACNAEVISNTWDGSVSFRGGLDASCGTTQLDDAGNIVYETQSDGSTIPATIPNKTYVDLVYDLFDYYEAQIFPGDSVSGDYTSFLADDGTLDTTIFASSTHAAITDDTCISYLQNQVGFTPTEADTICKTEFQTSNNNHISYGDLQNLICEDDVNFSDCYPDSTTFIENKSIKVCTGGEKVGKKCLHNSECPSYEVPNFLNFKNEETAYEDFKTSTGFTNLKNYIYINPEQNSVGQSRIRISAKDGGIAEDGTYTHKRTGYSTVKVTANGKVEGPEGELLNEEKASFGIVPDTWTWTIAGADARIDIPTELNRDHTFNIYAYHADTQEGNRIIDDCPATDGYTNDDGECCSKTPTTTTTDWYNTNHDIGGPDSPSPNPVYYEHEYIDELELYTEYFKGNQSKWCDITFSHSWTYATGSTFTNDNVGGFNPPNSIVNELDYTKSYVFKIIDVVSNYDSVGEQNQADHDGHNWWEYLGNWGDEVEWQQTWNATYREGWDTFGERAPGHPYGAAYPHSDAIVYESDKFIQGPDSNGSFNRLLTTGFEYKFKYPSIYKAIVYATDSYGIQGETWLPLDLTNLVVFNQTVLFRYSPWQGLNVTLYTDDDGATEPAISIPNISNIIESQDKDKRPSLGLWYYDDMLGNKSTDWFVRHGNSELGTHPYDGVEGGDFTITYQNLTEQCKNEYVSTKFNVYNSSQLGNSIPGPDNSSYVGCGHDGKWRGYIHKDGSTRSSGNLMKFTSFSIHYPDGHGPCDDYGATVECDEPLHNNYGWGTSPYPPTYTVTEPHVISPYDDPSVEYEDQVVTYQSKIAATNFSGIVKNVIEVPKDGTYAFGIVCDDTLTVTIDDVIVADSIRALGTFTVELTEGYHNIMCKFTQEAGLANWTLLWYVDGDGMATTDTSAGTLEAVSGTTIYHHFASAEDLEDFYPDADVRNPQSLGSSNAVLYKYYDKDLQPLAYEETSAPLTAQVFFYLRENTTNLFEEAKIVESDLQKGSMYVGFVNWGDGSPIEYDKEPFQLGLQETLKHTYEESGIYEITGDMFKVTKNYGGTEVFGITKFKEFLLRINVSKNPDIEGEFKLLGGTGYDFIPYDETSPVVSGVSDYSLYKKQLNSMNGVLREWSDKDGDNQTVDWRYLDVRIPVKYKFIGEQLSSELALATADEQLINPLIAAFTGSHASEIGLSSVDDVIIEFEDSIMVDGVIINVCDYDQDWTSNADIDLTSYTGGAGFLCRLPGSSGEGLFFMTGSADYVGVENLYKAAFKDCEDECVLPVPADSIRGFYDGTVDAITGNLVPDTDATTTNTYTQYQKPDGTYNTGSDGLPTTITTSNYTTPRFINTGVGTRFGELGDYLGDSDIGQVRYFDRPFDMWEMLGFESTLAGKPDEMRYWKNVIPEDYTIQNNRDGIGNLPPLPSTSGYFEVVFGWGGSNPEGQLLGNCSVSSCLEAPFGQCTTDAECTTSDNDVCTPIVCTSDDYCIASDTDKCVGSVYESVQILFSQAIANDIARIEFEFEGVELPEFDVDSGLGGVNDDSSPLIFDDDPFPFNAYMYGNTLILDHAEDAEDEGGESQIPIQSTRPDNIHVSELLVNLPILFREDKFGFKTIKVFTDNGGVDSIVPQSQHYMWNVYGRDYPYMAQYFGGISNLIVNEDDPQTWRPYCDNGFSISEIACCEADGGNWDEFSEGVKCTDSLNNWVYPYYPVLPKINKIGKFDEERLGLLGETEQIPFGSPNITWNEDDLYAPITSAALPEQWINYSLIDIDFSNIDDNALSDKGPINNHGILIDDYNINYDGDGGIKLDKQKPMLRTKLGKTKKDKPY